MPDLLIRPRALLDPDTGELLAGRRIVVDGGRVSAILEPGESGPDDGTIAVLDLPGLTALPGLIDLHAHLIGELQYDDAPAIGTTADAELEIGATNAFDTLRAGFTTVRDVGTFRALLDVRLRERIEAGVVAGPRMRCAGGFITTPGGGGEVTGDPTVSVPEELRQGVVRTPADVRRVVARFIDGGADVVKLIVTGAVLTVGTKVDEIELDRPMIEAAVDEAGRRGVLVAAHAHGAAGIRIAAEAGVRTIEHGSLMDGPALDAIIRNRTWWVADVFNGDWIDEVGRRDGWPAETLAKNAATTDAQRDAFRAALATPARLAFGTDSGVYPHGMNARQLSIMVRLGMTPLAAIRSATIDAAEALDWSDRVGSLTPGRYADLIAVAGDPTTDIALLERPIVVVKGGRVVRDDRPPA